MGGTQIGQSKSCNSWRSAARCCQPSMQICLVGLPTAMQQHQRHQPPLQIRRDIRCGVSEARKQALHPPRHAAGHQGARAKQVIFAPPVITSPKSISPAGASRAVTAQQEILRNIFAGQDHRRPVQRNQRAAASRSSSSSPSRNFCGNPKRSCRARHPAICPRTKMSQSGSIRASVPAGARCTSRNGLADFGKDALLVLFRQRRPCFRAQHARQPRDDEIWPSVALAFNDDFGDRNPKLSTKLRKRASFRDELANEEMAGIFSG